MDKINVGYIRDVIHISNILRFCIEM